MSIKIASDSIWTEKLAGTEPNFTAIGTAHIKDSGELMSKLSHVMIKWQRASALSQIFTRRNSKTPVFPGGSHEH